MPPALLMQAWVTIDCELSCSTASDAPPSPGPLSAQCSMKARAKRAMPSARSTTWCGCSAPCLAIGHDSRIARHVSPDTLQRTSASPSTATRSGSSLMFSTRAAFTPSTRAANFKLQPVERPDTAAGRAVQTFRSCRPRADFRRPGQFDRRHRPRQNDFLAEFNRLANRRLRLLFGLLSDRSQTRRKVP